MQEQKKVPEQSQNIGGSLPTAQTNAGPDTTKVLDLIDKAIGTVDVGSGAHKDAFEVAGKSVASVRKSLKTAWNIAADAQALVGSQPVDETYVLKAGEQLEFVRQTGDKGI